MVDKRITEEDVVSELRDGMTIGIGGWGSRRKPMSIVRAIANSDLKDLTLVSYGGPDVGILCATGKVKHVVYAFVSLDSIALEPHFRIARQQGKVTTLELDEGTLPPRPAGGRVAGALPADARRARLGCGRAPAGDPSRHLPVRRRRGVRRRTCAQPRRRHRAHAPRRRTRQRPVPQRRPVHGRPHGAGGAQGVHERREAARERRARRATARRRRSCISRLGPHGVVEAPFGAHFTECVPDYPRDEAFQREYTAGAKDADAWAGWKAKYLDCGDHAEYRKVVGL